MGHTGAVLPEVARPVVDDLLARLDRAVPGRIEGFYVVGSACRGAFRAGRSDLDFVAIVDGEFGRAELARLRAVHLGRWTSSLIREGAGRRRWPLVCNGCYVRPGDLANSPLEVTPLAGHVAGRFRVACREGFDVNPVTWHTLAQRGIAIRGPQPDRLEIRTDETELRVWTLANLNGYWRRWAERARRSHLNSARALPRRFAVGGVLGVPRLHYTLTSGAIATKEEAAEYGLEVFDSVWHPLIADALAYWRGGPTPPGYRHRPLRRRLDAAEFVGSVIEAGNLLMTRQKAQLDQSAEAGSTRGHLTAQR